jgi:hypothetical protein
MMMWWGPAAGPMWFWWVVPVVAVAICLLLVVTMVRAMTGGRFMCMGPHGQAPDTTSELRREVRELRDELNRMKAAR